MLRSLGNSLSDISDAKLIQLGDEASEERGLQATPGDDDTFPNAEKECLFLRTATWIKEISEEKHGVRFERPGTIALDGAGCPFNFRRLR